MWEAEGILVSLWLWGLDNADKFGFIPYADRSDIEIALSSSSKRSKLRLNDIVDALVESGWIDEDGDGIRLHDWEVWQDQWYKAKERREADAYRKRQIRSRQKDASSPDETGMSEESPQDIPPIVPQDSGDNQQEAPASGQPPDPPKSPTPEYTPAFQAFWEAYPRKIGKGEAYRKYQTRRKDGFSDAQLLEAAKNYAAQCIRKHTEKEYIKHPKTFLSDTLPFLDFLPKKPKIAEPEQPDTTNPFAEYGKEGLNGRNAEDQSV